MLFYEVDGSRYALSYSSLREDYLNYRLMTDEDFMANLVKILHFAVFVCFVKEAPSYVVLSDKGVIHELVHLLEFRDQLDDPQESFEVRLDRIRDTFNRWCCLA